MKSNQHPTSSISLVWFRLYNSISGKPCEGKSACKVAVSSSADIADFLNAVKDKSSNKRSSVDTAKLIVYKNKTAFDYRFYKGANGEPLEKDSLITGLGASEKEALIVVVPLSSVSAFTPAPLSPYQILSQAFPPLGRRETSFTVSETRLESVYNVKINVTQRQFGILQELKLANLNYKCPSLLWILAQRYQGSLGSWYGENMILDNVRNALIDCLTLFN